MTQIVETSSWCCTRKFNLISGQKYVGFFRANQRHSASLYLFQVRFNDYAIVFEPYKLGPLPSGYSGVYAMFMNFENQTDVDILLSDTIPKYELIVNYQKEIENKSHTPHNFAMLEISEYD